MKNYLIIGGSSGIGKALAEQLANKGNRVYATYFQNKITSNNDLLTYHPLSIEESAFDLSFLPEKLDGLAYCPGKIELKPFQRIKSEDMLADYNFQVLGFFNILKATISNLKASDQGSVVVFSTVAVQTGFPFHAQVSASKGALEGLTRSLAAELAPSVRVNCIAPSITDTPLAARLLSNEDKKEANAQRHPLKKIGQPEDIAEMAAFLLSAKSSWITGQVFHLDGGISTIKN